MSTRAAPAGGSKTLVIDHHQSLRLQHRHHMLSRVPAFLARGAWPAERIRAEREHRLRRLLAHAKRHSPWHAQRLTGIDPETFTESDLQRIPIMTKADLTENFDRIVTDRALTRSAAEQHLRNVERNGHSNPYLLDRYSVIASSGSSGPRGVFVYDWNGWTFAALSFARVAAMVAREVPRDAGGLRSATIAADAPSHLSCAIMQTFSPSTAMVPATLPLADIVDRLNRLQPVQISAYPSILALLCLAAERGALRIKPAVFTSTGEPLTADVHGAVERTFSAKVLDAWACSEAGTLAQSCPKRNGLHLNDDIAIVEPVDDEGRPVGPGTESSAILLTNLFNMLIPLIRYEISDRMMVIDRTGPCECGSHHARIAPIAGRSSDTFAYDAGVLVYAWALEAILDRDASVIDYRIQQTRAGARVSVTAAPGFDREAAAIELARALAAHGVSNPEVTIELMPTLPRGPTGKLVRSVALRPDGV